MWCGRRWGKGRAWYPNERALGEGGRRMSSHAERRRWLPRRRAGRERGRSARPAMVKGNDVAVRRACAEEGGGRMSNYTALGPGR
jgi:hypothetical protein